MARRQHSAHLTNGELLDTHQPPRRDPDIRTGRDDDRTLPSELQFVSAFSFSDCRLTSRVLGVRVFAAAPATIFPTLPDPVKRTIPTLILRL